MIVRKHKTIAEFIDGLGDSTEALRDLLEEGHECIVCKADGLRQLQFAVYTFVIDSDEGEIITPLKSMHNTLADACMAAISIKDFSISTNGFEILDIESIYKTEEVTVAMENSTTHLMEANVIMKALGFVPCLNDLAGVSVRSELFNQDWFKGNDGVQVGRLGRLVFVTYIKAHEEEREKKEIKTQPSTTYIIPLERVGELLQAFYDSEAHMNIDWMWDAGIEFTFGESKNSEKVMKFYRSIDATKIEQVASLMLFEFQENHSIKDTMGRLNSVGKFIMSLEGNDLTEGLSQNEGLRIAASPLIKYMCENCHPHATSIVTPTSVELLQGVEAIPKIHDFLVDSESKGNPNFIHIDEIRENKFKEIMSDEFDCLIPSLDDVIKKEGGMGNVLECMKKAFCLPKIKT